MIKTASAHSISACQTMRRPGSIAYQCGCLQQAHAREGADALLWQWRNGGEQHILHCGICQVQLIQNLQPPKCVSPPGTAVLHV